MNNKWLVAAAIAIVSLLAFFFYNKYQVAPKIDFSTLPLYDLNDRPVVFDPAAGKGTIVCFGASWCGSCIRELNELSAQSHGALAQVQVIVISDEPVATIRRFREKRNYPFTFYRLGTSFGGIGIHSIPTSYLFNVKGQLKKETVGFIDWSDRSTLHHHLKLME